MIVCLIVLALFVFKAPQYTWVGGLLCVAYLIVKHSFKERFIRKRSCHFDEFDWWQDNQGL